MSTDDLASETKEVFAKAGVPLTVAKPLGTALHCTPWTGLSPNDIKSMAYNQFLTKTEEMTSTVLTVDTGIAHVAAAAADGGAPAVAEVAAVEGTNSLPAELKDAVRLSAALTSLHSAAVAFLHKADHAKSTEAVDEIWGQWAGHLLPAKQGGSEDASVERVKQYDAGHATPFWTTAKGKGMPVSEFAHFHAGAYSISMGAHYTGMSAKPGATCRFPPAKIWRFPANITNMNGGLIFAQGTPTTHCLLHALVAVFEGYETSARVVPLPTGWTKYDSTTHDGSGAVMLSMGYRCLANWLA